MLCYHPADVGQPEDLVHMDPDGVVDGEIVFLEHRTEGEQRSLRESKEEQEVFVEKITRRSMVAAKDAPQSQMG